MCCSFRAVMFASNQRGRSSEKVNITAKQQTKSPNREKKYNLLESAMVGVHTSVQALEATTLARILGEGEAGTGHPPQSSSRQLQDTF